MQAIRSNQPKSFFWLFWYIIFFFFFAIIFISHYCFESIIIFPIIVLEYYFFPFIILRYYFLSYYCFGMLFYFLLFPNYFYGINRCFITFINLSINSKFLLHFVL